MITNEQGQVALVYYQPIPKVITVGEVVVAFDCQYGISLAFVSPELVDSLLGLKAGCCGSKQQAIFEASQVQYSHWLDGKGGR